MTPIERYQEDIKQSYINDDPLQRQALECLQTIYEQLIEQQSRSNLDKLKSLFTADTAPRGVYFWGGVGIGKTYLMDIFFEALPFDKKRRLHFHRFMQQVHTELKRLQGKSDPLQLIADQFAKECSVLCFDEFFVNDITDAMILAGLLEALFLRGITLVATSNVAPDNLYRNGLQRARFLPAIDLIKKFTHVIHIPSTIDYRLRTLKKAGVYFTPLNDDANTAMQQCFTELTHHENLTIKTLIINDRPIKTLGLGSDVVWFDFNDICSVPRSQTDYLEIASLYHTVLVSNVPQIQEQQDDKVTYLINLIDILYDRQVKLIISAQTPIEAIYPAGRSLFAFQRTQSRMLEMQSTDYLQREHLAY